MINSQLKEVFDDIILGNGVKQSLHSLIFESTDFTPLFKDCLHKKLFFPTPLKNISIEIGFRYPGFYIDGTNAYFGHLFWEVFSSLKKRKIWGSVIRNEKGDWKYILSGNSSNIVYINKEKSQAIDINYLT